VVTPSLSVRSLREICKAGQRLLPEALQEPTQRCQCLRVDAVQAPVALGPVDDRAGSLGLLSQPAANRLADSFCDGGHVSHHGAELWSSHDDGLHW
jgi:hypothetical protein